MKIAMTSVPVHNPVEAFKFYTEVLGFVEHTYIPEAYLAIVVSPEDRDGTTLLLEPIGDHPEANAAKAAYYRDGLPVIVFGVDDVQAEYERLKALGVTFRQEPTTTDYGTQAILDDTCGNYIQIHQAP